MQSLLCFETMVSSILLYFLGVLCKFFREESLRITAGLIFGRFEDLPVRLERRVERNRLKSTLENDCNARWVANTRMDSLHVK